MSDYSDLIAKMREMRAQKVRVDLNRAAHVGVLYYIGNDCITIKDTRTPFSTTIIAIRHIHSIAIVK